jgi:hypothetical protein
MHFFLDAAAGAITVALAGASARVITANPTGTISGSPRRVDKVRKQVGF